MQQGSSVGCFRKSYNYRKCLLGRMSRSDIVFISIPLLHVDDCFFVKRYYCYCSFTAVVWLTVVAHKNSCAVTIDQSPLNISWCSNIRIILSASYNTGRPVLFIIIVSFSTIRIPSHPLLCLGSPIMMSVIQRRWSRHRKRTFCHAIHLICSAASRVQRYDTNYEPVL